MTPKELSEFVEEFREGILDGKSSNMMCFAVCYPLAALLQASGVDCECVDEDFGFVVHTMIQCEDGTIIDPTADQFDDAGLAPVYIGPMPEIYQRWIESAKKQPAYL